MGEVGGGGGRAHVLLPQLAGHVPGRGAGHVDPRLGANPVLRNPTKKLGPQDWGGLERLTCEAEFDSNPPASSI